MPCQVRRGREIACAKPTSLKHSMKARFLGSIFRIGPLSALSEPFS
jgi:hypothetical protein